jgi:hypothetical protein
MVKSNPARTPITIANPFGESDRCGQMVNRSSGCDSVWFSLMANKMVILGRAVKMEQGIRQRIAFCRNDV